MAKWGEGDPRWIVEERPDATNVNNWHWTEKNATAWSKDRIKSLFKDFVIYEDGVECRVSEVEKLEGEASANNRKGKLIFFYEWNVVLKWSGKPAGVTLEKPVEGKITIPNLSEENEMSDLEITITIDESNNHSEKLKSFMYNVGRNKIREQLGAYISDLTVEFSKGMILPKKDQVKPAPVKSDGVSNITKNFTKKIDMEKSGDKTSQQPANVGYKLDVVTINIEEKFQCQASQLYDALTSAHLVTMFTRAFAKVDAVRGGDFSLFGGNITGKFQQLIPNKKIIQIWRYKQWPVGHFSTVTITIDEKVCFLVCSFGINMTNIVCFTGRPYPT